MNRKQSIYIFGWIVMLSFMTASLVSGRLEYLLGSSACIAIFGIGVGGAPRAGSVMPSKSWQYAMAMYLSVLAVFLLTNAAFVRDASVLTLVGLFSLPFLPMIWRAEWRKLKAKEGGD